MKKLLDEAISASLVIDRLIEGFLGLGLIVGVAALGVVTARAVVERRQQIGVLRAIGFQRRMVQASLLLESSFIALTAIIVGTGPRPHRRLQRHQLLGRERRRLRHDPEPHRSLAHARRDLPRRLPGRARRPRSYPPAMPPASTRPKHSATSSHAGREAGFAFVRGLLGRPRASGAGLLPGRETFPRASEPDRARAADSRNKGFS